MPVWGRSHLESNAVDMTYHCRTHSMLGRARQGRSFMSFVLVKTGFAPDCALFVCPWSLSRTLRRNLLPTMGFS